MRRYQLFGVNGGTEVRSFFGAALKVLLFSRPIRRSCSLSGQGSPGIFNIKIFKNLIIILMLILIILILIN